MPTTVDQTAECLNQRLQALIEEHSQAEIARKTDTSRNNVSRYANGTRMPLEFGSALVEGLGVNPAWLLTGEGTPYLSDVTADTQKMGGDLLALVKAMAAVNRMRLGSLAGKHHLGVLRELNETLQTYEELREKLNAQSRKIFQQLVNETRGALMKRDLNRAGSLLDAATQVSRLSDDVFLQTQFEALQSHFYHVEGKPEKALPHQRRSFLSFLVNHARFDEWTIPEAANYVMVLIGAHKFAEARRVARASYELADRQAPSLAAHAATLDFELGDLHRGLSELRRLIPRVEKSWAHNVEHTLARGQVLEGSMTMEQAITFGGDTEAKWSRLALVAAACEDKRYAELVSDRGIGGADGLLGRDSVLAVHNACLLQAFESVDSSPVQQLQVHLENTDQKQDEVSRFGHATLVTQLYRLGGDSKAALKHLMAAEELLVGLGTERFPRVEYRILHARNALKLIKPASAKAGRSDALRRASAFVREYYVYGYHCLRELTELAR